MFYLRVKLRFYGLDVKSFFYFTFKNYVCGYNKDLINRFISNLLKAHIIPDIRDSNSSQRDNINISNVRPKVVFLNLPYLDDTTSKVRNTILGFIKRYDPLETKLKIIILYKCCTVGQFFHIKTKYCWT